MVIGVISDTHRMNRFFYEIAEAVKDTDILIHLGDNVQDVDCIKKYYKKDIINVRGNCDFNTKIPLERIEEMNGVKILVTHGHNYDVKYNILRLKYRALELGVDIVLFGHTHVSQIVFQDGVWFINPGSAALPRDAHRSFATIKIEDGQIRPSIKLL
ncbi:metallophosphoesterase [Clostridium aestuarii]|uniref:Phosphoesterase n=1 Tax=Clostridium aestuarii TaxID=338193 RepID=A0ABT4CZK5_9CLOT|nr:metallophosphoesterase [Clostridium aestuarii]MCY6484412.1 metallophosphoesterase [Clostridium aestuarii]